MKVKIATVAILGAISLGLSQSALAWTSGTCAGQSSPCVEYSESGSSYYTTSPTGWTGVPPTGTSPFTFSGDTTLVCGVNTVQCTLSLDGNVSLSGSNVGIQVVSADVTGPLFSGCNAVDVGGFDWYIGPDSYHGPYTASQSIPASGPYVGSIGPINVSVPLLGIDVQDGHMHEVTYNNLDTFSFGTGDLDPIIYVNGASDDPSGCTVTGDLRLEPTGATLTIQ